MNDLQKHKKSDGVKWVLTVIAVLLLAVAVTAAITQGFKNWNPYGWLDKKDAEETPAEEKFGGMLIGDSSGDGIAVTSIPIARANYAANDISPLAESAYTLTATVTPEDASNKAVDWAVSFVNSESEWAAGKTVTDYVTVTPTADGALTANVECLEAFGEQVTVTVTSRDNAEATASCTVDYAKRMTAAQLSFSGTNAPSFVLDSEHDANVLRSSFTSSNIGYGVTPSYTYSVGTVDDEMEIDVVLRFSPDFIISYPSAGGSVIPVGVFNTLTRPLTSGNLPTGFPFWSGALGQYFNQPVARNEFATVLSRIATSVPVFSVYVTAEGAYSSFECEYSLLLNATDFAVMAESVTLDETGLVF